MRIFQCPSNPKNMSCAVFYYSAKQVWKGTKWRVMGLSTGSIPFFTGAATSCGGFSGSCPLVLAQSSTLVSVSVCSGLAVLWVAVNTHRARRCSLPRHKRLTYSIWQRLDALLSLLQCAGNDRLWNVHDRSGKLGLGPCDLRKIWSN